MPLDLDTPVDLALPHSADAISVSTNCRPGDLRPLFGDNPTLRLFLRLFFGLE